MDGQHAGQDTASDLESRITIVESHPAAIRLGVDALQATYDLLAARQDATEARQARPDQNFPICFEEIKELQERPEASLDDG